MVQSTEEPQVIEIQSTKKIDDGIKVNLLVHWSPQQITVNDMDNKSHQEWEYEEEEFSFVYEGDPAQLDKYIQDHQKELLLKSKGKAGKLDAKDEDHLSYPSFKADSTYRGTIAKIDKANKKVKVEKTVSGKTVSAWCYVDYTLLLAYKNGDLAVGDMVVVSFVDEDLSLPYAHGLPLGV